MQTIILVLLIGLSFVLSEPEPCPLNFESLEKLINSSSTSLKFNDLPTECTYMLKGLRFLRAEYLRSTGRFSPPNASLETCWADFQSLVNANLHDFNLQSSCGFKVDLLLGSSCMNVTTRSDFERRVSGLDLDDLTRFCNQSLEDDSSCMACNERLVRIGSSYFEGPIDSDCGGYPVIYAAAVNSLGPTDLSTARCLFSLDLSNTNKKGKKNLTVFWGIFTGCANGIFGTLIVLWFVWLWHLKNRTRNKTSPATDDVEEAGPVSEADMIKGRASSLIRFTIEEVSVATDNFSRKKLIGKGGFGNVYKGVLSDGSEVALKRFKSCGAVEDAMFSHEVEVIASVSHVNLVALRGYCTGTLPWEGHQRIIVCDLVRNGSLFDHMFGSARQEVGLSWPVRQRIALGTARGLAYLHYGAQPAIIHRDVKASNILLDEEFEPRLADFGLAKFTPAGQSHVSTKVAGTFGYVAPEYALYGQLTERSDVYSFGVVLLEILSGKNAFTSTADGETVLLADWAWSLVRQNKALDVVDRGIPDLCGPELLEKYVWVAVLCSHPLLYARPTMDRVVQLLETDSPMPLIPDRPTLFTAASDGIEMLSTSISGGSYHGFSTDSSTS